jgi:DNA repair exonuclease SbcCD nuclease subunit
MEIQLNTPEIFFTFFTDVHLSDRPPGRRMGNYREEILAKLRFMQEWTNSKNGIGLCGGDVFHSKSPISPSNPTNLITETMDILKGFNHGHVWGIVGNHDVQWDRIETLPNQPLGLLQHGGAYEVMNEPTTFLSNTGFSVQIVPFHFGPEVDVLARILDMDAQLKEGPQPNFRIGMAHAMARKGGAQSLFGHPIIGYDLLEGIGFDAFLWGHDHSFIPPTEIGQCLHLHPGSFARAAFSSDEAERDVLALGLRFESEEAWGVISKKVPSSSLEIAFRTGDIRVRDVEESGEVLEFVRGIGSKLGTIGVVDALKVVEELCSDDPEMNTLIHELCDF